MAVRLEKDTFGVWRRGEETFFRTWSAHARELRLCLFDAPDSVASRREIAMRGAPDGSWSVSVPGLPEGQLYGYRADGPWAPQRGHRFNPSKLLVDPAARAITGEPLLDAARHPSLFSYPAARQAQEAMSYDSADSAGSMPKCVVVAEDNFDWQGVESPRIGWNNTVIYECHVRGMTQRHPQVDPALRGTYLGLASAPVLEHLSALGVTAIELMPVQHMASEAHLVGLGLRNYWGYNPLGWCAPASTYATGSRGEQISEFKTMVRELHRAGFEVILDVVFNHSAEAGRFGPTLSLKGLDNRCYFALQRQSALYWNASGCGNTLDFGQPAVRRLVLDSLRHWVREYQIDGFRLDLAPIVGRASHGSGRRGELSDFDPGAEFFSQIDADPVLAGVKWIAEPWDVGPNGYQLGRFPRRFSEWNDRYRDSVRRFWRGDGGQLAELATRIAGSRDCFEGQRASINFITSHDGFTLLDLVSYETKHNQANGEDNRDGQRENYSANWGHEGPSDSAEVQQRRDRARRSLLATLVFSYGTPMVLHGDEVGRTQRGNNNAYCHDSELTWINWSEADLTMVAYVSQLLRLRRRFGGLSGDAAQLRWWHPDGRQMTRTDWHDKEQRTLGWSQCVASSLGEEWFLVMANGSADPVSFATPDAMPTEASVVDSASTVESASIKTTSIPASAAPSIAEKISIGRWRQCLDSATSSVSIPSIPAGEVIELAPTSVQIWATPQLGSDQSG